MFWHLPDILNAIYLKQITYWHVYALLFQCAFFPYTLCNFRYCCCCSVLFLFIQKAKMIGSTTNICGPCANKQIHSHTVSYNTLINGEKACMHLRYRVIGYSKACFTTLRRLYVADDFTCIHISSHGRGLFFVCYLCIYIYINATDLTCLWLSVEIHSWKSEQAMNGSDQKHLWCNW